MSRKSCQTSDASRGPTHTNRETRIRRWRDAFPRFSLLGGRPLAGALVAFCRQLMGRRQRIRATVTCPGHNRLAAFEQLEPRALLTTIDLAVLTAAEGSVIFGADASDRSGYSVSSAGDVNGDGFDDLLIGADGGDGSGNSKFSAGESYVIFGGAPLPATINLASPGPAGITIFGADAGDGNGRSVSSAGDVNGDGFDDLLIGARLADGSGNGKSEAGESYVIFGGASLPATIDLASLGPAGVTIFGADADDHSGSSVSSAGDVNGDGFDDLLIGAELADASVTNTKEGKTYVIFGGASLPATIDLASLGAAGITIFGADADDRSGRGVSGAGDVNGDGFDDLLIGTDYADASGNGKFSAGESYVIFGGASLPATIDLASLGTAGITIFGADVSDRSGRSVSSAGDVNGDGFDDLLIGASDADASAGGKSSAGESYVIFGKASLPATIDLASLGAAGITVFGADAGDGNGRSVSSAGDVNGDGFDDLLIGAYRADASGNGKSEAGESYVIFGGDFTGDVTHPGTVAADTLTGDGSANVMIGGRGSDTLLGNGGADVLRGGEGDDTLAVADLNFSRVVGGTGSDTLRLDTAGATLNLTALTDNRILGVEQIDLGGGANSLVLDVQEVLNISDESNTLNVLRDTDGTVVLDNGWQQQADERIGPNTFRVFTQGQATVKVQTVDYLVYLRSPGDGLVELRVQLSGDQLQIVNDADGQVLREKPLDSTTAVHVVGVAGENDRLTVDYEAGGFFALAGGIDFTGGAGGSDELIVMGGGATRSRYVSDGGPWGNARIDTFEADQRTAITFTDVEPLSLLGMLTAAVEGSLDLGAQTLTVGAGTLFDLGSLTTLDGGTIHASGGVALGSGENLIGLGTVSGRIAADAGSSIQATGALTLGDPASPAGFLTRGELHVREHTVTLRDFNQAVLGSLTTLGTAGATGTLVAANGAVVDFGQNVTGRGTLSTPNDLLKPLTHNGAIIGDADVAGQRIILPGYMKGVGTRTNAQITGTDSPGFSPAIIYAGNLTFDTGSTLIIELGGTTPGSDHDQIQHTGTATLSGILEVRYLGGFRPSLGDRFEIITADGGRNGRFDPPTLPELDAGLTWDVEYNANDVTLEVIADVLAVDTFAGTPGGFVIDFTRAIDPAVLNLYDGAAGSLGPADVTLAGNATGGVTGSLVVSGNRLTFIATGGVLPTDTYTVTLRSADNAVRDLSGELLDGDSNGSPGGDYQTAFVVAAPESVVVSLPDFTRGPSQDVNLPADGTGLPLMLTDGRVGGDGITSVQLTITYDAALLAITAAVAGPDAPGAVVAADTDTPGQIIVSFTTATALASGEWHFVALTATVPSGAEYGAAHVLDVSGVSINGGGNPTAATANDALHLAAYIGDATGNGTYSGLDAQRVARVGVGLDGGLEAFPQIDPVIVADVTGNGALSGLDAQRIAQEAVGLDAVAIPPIPQPQPLRLANDRSRSRETSDGAIAPSTDHPNSGELGYGDLAPVVEAAVARIELAGHLVEADVLQDVPFEIIDPSGDLLGRAFGQTVQIDINAAGYGWFIDAKASHDAEFGQRNGNGAHRLTALRGSSAADRVDLLTVIMHEFGNALGHDHSDGGVMDESLPLGTRRVWDDESLLDDSGELGTLLDAADLATPAIDDYFAAI